jgi:PleD family two-component response regulator
MILFDCALPKATAQIDRTREWVCGNHTVEGRSGQIKLKVNASMGVAEYRAPETMKNLLSRADAAMYQNKSSTRASECTAKA